MCYGSSNICAFPPTPTDMLGTDMIYSSPAMLPDTFVTALILTWAIEVCKSVMDASDR